MLPKSVVLVVCRRALGISELIFAVGCIGFIYQRLHRHKNWVCPSDMQPHFLPSKPLMHSFLPYGGELWWQETPMIACVMSDTDGTSRGIVLNAILVDMSPNGAHTHRL